MPDIKVTDLERVSNVLLTDVLYVIQDGQSKQITAGDLFKNIRDPEFKGNIFLLGNTQVLTSTNVAYVPIDNNQLKTEFYITEEGTGYPTLPDGQEGQLKILSLIDNTSISGEFTIDVSNSVILSNTELTFFRPGDTAFMLYTDESWRVLGTSPGFKSNISGTTDDILEAPGTANLYYTNTRARAAISAGDQTIIYNDLTGEIKANVDFLFNVDISIYTTDNLPEGQSNLYYTADRAIVDTEPERANLRADIQHPTANVIYVKSNGRDDLDGRTEANALANIHVALARANAWTTVRVKSGDYKLWDNPVTIPERVALVGDDLRTTTIRPQNLTDDMFYVENACYVWGFTFRDHESPSAVFSYNPDGSAGNIITSPYIQNCSSITTTGTGMRVDGSLVGGLRSMVCDSYTQTNSGGIGIHMLNRGYTQLVSVFTICCQIAILCEDGGFCSITNSNSSFGTYGLVADGVSIPLYYGEVVSIINSRTVEMRNLSQRPSVGDVFLFADYNQTKCSRDTGLIVDGLAMDLAYNGNTQSTFSGLQYYAQAESSIPGQAEETIAAMRHIKALAANVILSIGAHQTYQNGTNQTFANTTPGSFNTRDIVTGEVDLIIDLVANGTVGVTDRVVPNGYPANADIAIQNASNLLLNNKSFIQAETVAFVNTTYPSFVYDQAKCSRDTGYIIDSIAFDLRHGGNRQAIMSGVYYYNFNANVTQINNQVVQTGAAYEFIKSISDDIIKGVTIVDTYQSNVTQNTTAAPAATQAEVDRVNNNIDLIVDIITNGPAQAPAKRPISLSANVTTNTVNAVTLLNANKDFIKAEVLAFTNRNWANISNGAIRFFTVNEATSLDVANANSSIVIMDEQMLTSERPLIGSSVSFHQPSYISASSHTFEYVGSGNELATALPYAGGIPVQENEVIQQRGGAVYYTSTDHKGDFRIGDELLINRASGTINGRTFNKSLFAVMTPYILAITPD
jgi:hypothetical protein